MSPSLLRLTSPGWGNYASSSSLQRYAWSGDGTILAMGSVGIKPKPYRRARHHHLESDQVSFLQSRFIGRAARFDGSDDHSLGLIQAKILSDLWGHRLNGQTKITLFRRSNHLVFFHFTHGKRKGHLF